MFMPQLILFICAGTVGVIGGSDGGESNEDDQGMLVIRKSVLYLQITCMGWSYFCLNSDKWVLYDLCASRCMFKV